MEKAIIRQIVANILYLEDETQIKNDASLFTNYDLSSIDYIDLCFELSQKSNKDFKPDELWPFNVMLTNPEYYSKEKWTENGLNKIYEILKTESEHTLENITELYNYFTVDYIHKRLEALG